MDGQVILANPQNDTDVARLRDEATDLNKRAEALIVSDDMSMVAASDDLNKVSELKRAIETLRTSYTAPLNSHLKEVNALFKEVAAPIDAADKTVRGKVLSYQAEVNRRKSEIERLNAEKMRLAQEEMRINGELSQPVDLMPETDEAPRIITTTGGEVTTKQIWKWELVDIRLVPSEYLIVNEKKVGREVREGARDIPGIKIYPEDILSVKPHAGGVSVTSYKLTETGKAKAAELKAEAAREELPDFGEKRELPAF